MIDRKTTRVCEPVFVVGMNGSGTSMMLDSLGRHPELYAVPHETLMMPYVINNANRFGDLEVDQNYLGYWQYAIDQMPQLLRFNDGRKPDIPENWSVFPRTIEGVFDGIFSTFAADQGKRRWCEKTPDHVQHLPLLAKVFPASRFIHMIRDGREVACSIHRRQFRRPELVIYRWKKLIALGRESAGKLADRYVELRYEDLTTQPEDQMRRICSFLGLEFHESVLQSRLPQNPKRRKLQRGELSVIAENPVKWPGYFDSGAIRRLETVGGKMLQDLGYVPEATSGDNDPSWLMRIVWRVTDFVRLTWARLRDKRDYVSWKNVFQKVIYSYREYRSKPH